jgi:hypothetical protein
MTGDPNLLTPAEAFAPERTAQDDAGRRLSDYVLTEEQAKAAAQQADADHTSVGEVMGTFGRALVYSAIQTPLDGSTQLLNGALRPVVGDRQLIPRIELLHAPDASPFGSQEWVARLAGGGIGTILPFYAGGKLATRAVGRLSGVKYVGPAIERTGILKENSLANLAFKGAVYEGIFHPVDETAGGFWSQRAVNFGAGGVSFLAMGYANQWMRNSRVGQWALGGSGRAMPITAELLIDAKSGAVAGVTDSALHSFAAGKLPDAQSLAQSAGEYAFMGAFLRLSRMPIEKAATEKAATPKQTATETLPHDPTSLRPRLPFDKTTPGKSAVLSDGLEAEFIGMQRGTKKGMFYRELPETLERPSMRLSQQEFDAGKYQTVRHKGQDFAVGADGKAYTLRKVDGQVELVLTDKVILERLNEVQVPWPPIQSQEQYRSGQTIRFADLFAR